MSVPIKSNQYFSARNMIVPLLLKVGNDESNPIFGFVSWEGTTSFISERLAARMHILKGEPITAYCGFTDQPVQCYLPSCAVRITSEVWNESIQIELFYIPLTFLIMPNAHYELVLAKDFFQMAKYFDRQLKIRVCPSGEYEHRGRYLFTYHDPPTPGPSFQPVGHYYGHALHTENQHRQVAHDLANQVTW